MVAAESEKEDEEAESLVDIEMDLDYEEVNSQYDSCYSSGTWVVLFFSSFFFFFSVRSWLKLTDGDGFSFFLVIIPRRYFRRLRIISLRTDDGEIISSCPFFR